MATTIPTVQKSQIKSFTQTVMPFVRALSEITLIYCVLVAARATFYRDLPQHSPKYMLWQLATALIALILLKAVQWRKTTG